MVETLTESFCERCGTRYEFRAPTRLNPLRKTRGLFGGLKNYLTSQDALSDALGDAMRSEEEQLAAAQLDAFHQTFNFCISCRQYTCVSCWNDPEGRCRSCAPIAGTDDLTDRLLAAQPGAAAIAEPSAEPMLESDELSRRLGMDAWPQADRTAHQPATNGHAPHEWPEAEALTPPPADAEADAWVEPEPEPMMAEVEPEPEPEPMVAEVEAEPEPEPVVAEVEPEPEPMVAEVEPEPEPVVAEVEPEPEPLRVVAWEPDSADSVVEPEPMVAEVEPEPEPILAEAQPEPEPEPMVAQPEPEPEPEPMVAEAEPEPEPVADEPPPMRVGPISETILRFPQRPIAPPVEEQQPSEPESPEVAARRAQLDLLGLGDPGEGPVGPERPAVLPYRSRGATPTPVELAMRAGGTNFWEASAREVAGAAAQIGVQNCGECGLSLSATARFCRRCGTRQARSA
ncbi:MAG TPA: hypothetical protein VHR55_09830 [Candidatus Limnocylindria bacterium]|nr:hypothetical protein [Candidatus Limnocylindria bacterium]